MSFYTIKLINPNKLTLCSFNSNKTNFITENAEINKIYMPTACNIGNCTTCLSKLIYGKIVMQPQKILSPNLIKNNFILPCITQNLSNIILITYQEQFLY